MVAEMLRKLRRGIKDTAALEDGALAMRPRKDSAAVLPMETSSSDDRIAHATSTNDERPKAAMNFLHLPPELRNRIYEFVICDATLTLPSTATTNGSGRKLKLPLRRRKQVETPLNGLLLTNRQLRTEYLSLLLSTAAVVVEVRDFDFEHVARVSSALSAEDMKCLQSNRHLTLQLITQNCTARNLSLLRRWLDFREENDTDLPWNYEVPLSRLLPGTTMGRVRLLRELEYYADTIATLVVDLEEGQKGELGRVIEAFEGKAAWLEGDLGWLGVRSKTAGRGVRGLAGGGL